MLTRRKKIGIAIGAGVAAAIALIVIIVVSTNKKGDPDNDGKDDKDDIGPLDGPWDNVSCDRQSAWSWLVLDPQHE